MAIRTLLFDLGDTILRLDPYPEALRNRLLAERCVEAGLRGEAALDFVASVARGAKSVRRPRELDILRIVRSVAPKLAEAAARRVADAWGEADLSRLEVPTGRRELLEDFRRQGFRLGVVSNTTTSAALLDGFLATAGLRDVFDVVVYSSAFGRRKPAPEIFQEALRLMAAGADEALYVGDRYREDVQGPEAAGIRGVLTHEFRREMPPMGTRTIARLADVLGHT